MRNKLNIIAGGLSIAVAGITLSAVETDLDKIRMQSRAFYATNCNDAKVKLLLERQLPDGSWPNIDYKDTSRNDDWQPRSHLRFLCNMAICHASEKSKLHNNEKLLDGIRRGLDFWAKGAFVSDNWWYQSIGTPQLLAEAMLTVGKENLSPELMERLFPVFERSTPGMTAQNKVWRAAIHLQKGLLYDKPEWVSEGAKYIEEELYVAKLGQEGIQPDWSFHQHGPQLQFGNYGAHFFRDMVSWALMLKGTRFEFPEKKIKILDHYYHNGLRWVLFDRQMDFNACGRQINRAQPSGKYAAIVSYANHLYALLGKKENITETDFLFSGCRNYYDSDFLVFRGPDTYWSVRMCSKRITGSESTNNENLLGRLTGHGLTCFASLGGNELLDVGALWNWRRLPGVTAVQNEADLRCKDPGLTNVCEFVGSLSDGTAGFAAMDYDNGEAKAKKSCFFAGNTMFAMGSRITSNLDAPVNSSIAQHRIKNAPGVNGSAVVADAFSYKVFSPAEFKMESGEVSGNWKRVSQYCPRTPVKGQMFSLWIDHGVKPANGSYAYAAGRNVKDLDNWTQLKADSDAIHAVAEKSGTVMIAFYEPGTVMLPGGAIFSAAQPVLAMLKDGKLFAADPTQKLKTAEFSLNDKKIEVALPKGQ